MIKIKVCSKEVSQGVLPKGKIKRRKLKLSILTTSSPLSSVKMMSNVNPHEANKTMKKDEGRLVFKLDVQKSRLETQNISEKDLLVINFVVFLTEALLVHGMQSAHSIS